MRARPPSPPPERRRRRRRIEVGIASRSKISCGDISSGGRPMRRLLTATLLFLAPFSLLHAATLRWSSQGDYLTADPMAQNELLTNSINGHVYESLVERGKNLELLPSLATSWKQTSPTVWVFNLRKGVKFHDGSDFTADDVVFSIKR